MSAARLFTAASTEVPDISDRQFAQGIWAEGLITYDECQAFVGQGTIPAALGKIIAALPDDGTGNPTPRKIATILVTGATVYQRTNPLVDQLAAAEGWDGPTTDAKWRAWALL